MVYLDGITLLGNFLIEAMEHNIYQFEIKKTYDFNKVLHSNLHETIYYTNFVPADVINFLERFPEFLHASGSYVMIPKDDVKKTKRLLKKQFRNSLSEDVVQIIHKSFETIFM